MGKLLFLLLLAIVVWWAVRTVWRARGGAPVGEAPSSRAAEDMVRCERCGVHLPRSESLMRAGKLYCSEDHARLP